MAGLAALAVSFVPFNALQARVRGISGSGQGTFFSPEFYRAMQMRLRLIALANLAVGIVLFIFRRQMVAWARRVSSESRILVRDFRAAASSIPAIDMVTLTGLVLFATLLRIPLLSQPMRYDEAITFLEYASRPFYVALSFYSTPNNHLFHTLLVRLAYLALGNHPWALRLPALLAGLCLVPATYAAARSLYRNTGALLAAGLVASSSTLIEYSTNARGYAMVCLLFMMLIAVGAYALRRQNWAAWLLLAIVAALGFYTIPIMLYPFGGVVVWLLISIALGDAKQNARESAGEDTNESAQGDAARRAVAGLFTACLLTMLLAAELYSPVLAVSGPKLLFANKWVAPGARSVFYDLPTSLASTWRAWNRDVPPWLTAGLAGGFLISLLGHWRVSRQRMPLALALLLWVGPVVWLQRVIPFERVWLFALPLYFIGAAAGLALALESVVSLVQVLVPVRVHVRLPLQQAVAFLAVALALFAGVRVERSGSVFRSNESRGMPTLAIWLKGQLRPGDLIVAVPPSDGPLRYYLQIEGVPASYLAAYSSLNLRGPGGPSPAARHIFLVVNQAAGDTVERVCATAGLPHPDRSPAKVLLQQESTALYDLPF